MRKLKLRGYEVAHSSGLSHGGGLWDARPIPCALATAAFQITLMLLGQNSDPTRETCPPTLLEQLLLLGTRAFGALTIYVLCAGWILVPCASLSETAAMSRSSYEQEFSSPKGEQRQVRLYTQVHTHTYRHTEYSNSRVMV